MEKAGEVIRVAGPLVVAKGMEGSRMYDVVRVGELRLIGEIVELQGDRASIQVYEDTTGVGPGDPVYPTFAPLTVELGPGLIGNIYDGVQRPLPKIIETTNSPYIQRGIDIPALDRTRKWKFTPIKNKGDKVVAGDILGEVQETSLVVHKILVPPDIESGTLVEIVPKGEYSVDDIIARVETPDGKKELKLYHKWPVRIPRPYKQQFNPIIPLYTGQRVIDTFFPITKGGTACVPGPFGSGKTVIQHQLAKWADADIVVFVGCGERGNEMTDMLIEFAHLKDPRSGRPLMERTVLIANTSNMPVAAREASVYTGVTIAEYFRDMGYNVALMADSTSRWAEAMREISGRLEEMPGEEGYPAYLATRVAEFYERAGWVETLGSDNRKGAVSIIGSVSPPGGDLSDPVVQATLRVTKVFWSLEEALAQARHFPAISWLRSYSLYWRNIEGWVKQNIGEDFPNLMREAMRILEKEAELQEIVRLVGYEGLSYLDIFLLEVARSLREDFLYQNAFDPVDTYCSPKKQYYMLQIILKPYYIFRTSWDRFIADRGTGWRSVVTPTEFVTFVHNLEFWQDLAKLRFMEDDEIMRSMDTIIDKITTEINNKVFPYLAGTTLEVK